MRYLNQLKLSLMIILLSLMLGACTTLSDTSAPIEQNLATEQVASYNGDPFERVNRSIYTFNSTLDEHLLKPIAQAYSDYLPQSVRSSVRNFFANLWEPNTTVNALLQGKGKLAAKSTARFLLNSTVGVLGVFDVASPLGVPKQKEDFGQTLAVWGVGEGPYLMLPFLGASNLRDFSGLLVQTATTDLVPPLFDGGEQIFATGTRLLDTRVSLLGADDTLALQVDPYLFLRESYRQARVLAIYDGKPPVEEDNLEAEIFGD